MPEHTDIPPVVAPRRIRVVTKVVMTSTYIIRLNNVLSVLITLVVMTVSGFLGWVILDGTGLLATTIGSRLYFVGWAVIGLVFTALVRSRINRYLIADLHDDDPDINYTSLEEFEEHDP